MPLRLILVVRHLLEPLVLLALLQALGFSWLASILLLLPGLFAVRLAEMAFQFAVARCLRGEPFQAPLAAWWRESVAWSLFGLLQIPAVRPYHRGDRPVTFVLVHGYACTGGVWSKWMQPLKAAGYGLVVPDLEPWVLSRQQSVESLARVIADLPAEQRLVLVGHSMGGVELALCLRDYPQLQSRCVRLITLASPHHGSKLAGLALTPGDGPSKAVDSWLDVAPAVPTTCVVSMDDNLVVPADSASLPNADHLWMRGAGHLALLNRSDLITTLMSTINADLETHQHGNRTNRATV